MTQTKTAWQLNNKETPVFIPPWLMNLDRGQRQDLYAQYKAATDSKRVKALAAAAAVGLGGYGAAYIHGKNKMTRELAPERNPDPNAISVDPENLGSAEKLSNITIGSQPQRSVFGDFGNAVGKTISNATNSGISASPLSNPSVVWGLGVGAPALGVGTLAYKALIDKLYKPPTEGQKELENAQREFNALLSGDEQGIKESGLTKTAAFISAFEERHEFKKQGNMYASLLPALAAISALSTGYVTANHLSKTDPDVIKKDAAEEAMKRLRASQPPKLQAIAVDSPQQYTEMAGLDNLDRNVIPVLKKKLVSKGRTGSNDFFSKMSADISAQQLAGAIQQMSQKNPEAINGLIDYLKENNPKALSALGGNDLDNNQLTGNLVKMLSGTGPIAGMKANIAKNQILQNINNLPPEYTKHLEGITGAPAQAPSMTSKIQPWQVGAAAASAGIGMAANKPLMGAVGAGAALYGPQMWEQYRNSRPTSDASRNTQWMNGQNSHIASPYLLKSEPVTARPTGHLGTTIATAKNAISTVGRGVKNTAVDIGRGAKNLAWRVKEPVHQAVQDTFFRPPANQNRSSSFYDLTHFKDL